MNTFLGFFDTGVLGIVSNAIGVADLIDSTPTDGFGNVLYIEIGYTIIQFNRVYYWDTESHSENQYIVLDENYNCVFNKTIKETWTTD